MAARGDAEGPGREDGRRRAGWCSRHDGGFLALEDGTVFRGESVGADGFAFGEAVFTTAMTGYQEIVTDPSYAGAARLLHGADGRQLRRRRDARSESRKAHAKAVLMREARGPAWTDWLHEHGIVALDRHRHALARAAPARGAARCAPPPSRDDSTSTRRSSAVREQPSMEGRALVAPGLRAEPYVFATTGASAVAVVDYGGKRSILRRLAGAGAAVTVFPHDVDADELAGFDGVLLSNGPGDPGAARRRGRGVRELLGRVPVLGICLGHQLLGLATGHETYKLPFGHRGANHPVLERATGRVLVTSQNHGFAVEPSDDARGDARLALRRHRRGPRLPRAARPLGAVPSRGRPRARTTPGRSSSAGSRVCRGARRCRVGPTSSRSA